MQPERNIHIHLRLDAEAIERANDAIARCQEHLREHLSSPAFLESMNRARSSFLEFHLLASQPGFVFPNRMHFLPFPNCSDNQPRSRELDGCYSCQHYDGGMYNGVKFCCAMHPYGWEEGEQCPDLEGFNS